MKPIKITDRAYRKLKDYKVHPSQPFWQIVNTILKISEYDLKKKEVKNGSENGQQNNTSRDGTTSQRSKGKRNKKNFA